MTEESTDGLGFGQVVIDCANAVKLAEFWASLVGREVDPGASEFYAFVPASADRTFPALMFLQVPESRAGKNRWHLDFYAADPAAQVQRALALGAEKPATSTSTGRSGRPSPIRRATCSTLGLLTTEPFPEAPPLAPLRQAQGTRHSPFDRLRAPGTRPFDGLREPTTWPFDGLREPTTWPFDRLRAAPADQGAPRSALILISELSISREARRYGGFHVEQLRRAHERGAYRRRQPAGVRRRPGQGHHGAQRGVRRGPDHPRGARRAPRAGPGGQDVRRVGAHHQRSRARTGTGPDDLHATQRRERSEQCVRDRHRQSHRRSPRTWSPCSAQRAARASGGVRRRRPRPSHSSAASTSTFVTPSSRRRWWRSAVPGASARWTSRSRPAWRFAIRPSASSAAPTSPTSASRNPVLRCWWSRASPSSAGSRCADRKPTASSARPFGSLTSAGPLRPFDRLRAPARGSGHPNFDPSTGSGHELDWPFDMLSPSTGSGNGRLQGLRRRP